jgi:peptide/nickel transport system substrate-binding protein
MGNTSRPTVPVTQKTDRPAVRNNRFRGVISRRELLTTAAAITAGTAGAVRGIFAGLQQAPMNVAFAAAAPRSGGSLVYAIDQPVTTLDANLDGHRLNQVVFFQIFDPLIVRDKRDNKFKPWLATSWDVSADGKTYTFHLRPGIKFHDGTPLNAEAVKFNFDRTHNPALATQAPVAIGFYDSTEVVDTTTVRVHLKNSWAPFLDAVSYAYRMVSPAGVQKVGDKDFGRHPVGSGPFRFAEWVENQRVVLERNPDYPFTPTIFSRTGPALLDRVIFRMMLEPSTRVAALESGEVQVITAVPAQDFQRLNHDPRFKPFIGISPGVGWTWAINVTKPPTDELPVRLAINYGIDRQAIAVIVYGPYQPYGAFRPAYGSLVPSTWGYNKRSDIYRYDPAKAKDLLEKAGWKTGPDGIRQKNGTTLQIVFNSWEHGIPEVVQSQLRAIGVDLKVGVLDVASVNTAQVKQDSHMSPVPGARSDPDVLSAFLNGSNVPGASGGNGVNFDFVNDSALDKVFNDAAAEVNVTKRENLYQQAEQRIAEMGYLFPVTTRDNATLTTATVQDLQFDALGFFPWLHDAWLQR